LFGRMALSFACGHVGLLEVDEPKTVSGNGLTFQVDLISGGRPLVLDPPMPIPLVLEPIGVIFIEYEPQ
jgi:hypothetical protein